jgi:hypothetical protein
MKITKLKAGDRVTWYGESGTVVTVPTEPGGEYGVKLDSGRIIFDDDGVLEKEAKKC